MRFDGSVQSGAIGPKVAFISPNNIGEILTFGAEEDARVLTLGIAAGCACGEEVTSGASAVLQACLGGCSPQESQNAEIAMLI